MGIQSQARISSIKKMMKQKPAKKSKSSKHKRNELDGNQRTVYDVNVRAFHPHLDCAICKARHENRRVPHRSHHNQCPEKRNQYEMVMRKEQNRLKTLFSQEVESAEKEKELTGGGTPSIADVFQPPTMEYNTFHDAHSSDVEMEDAEPTFPKFIPAGSSPEYVALFFENTVKKARSNGFPLKQKSTAPEGLVAILDEIMNQTKHNKPVKVGSPPPTTAKALENYEQARERFRTIFGKNNMVYEIPEITDLSHPIDPVYHSLVGSKIIIKDLELAFPDLEIFCVGCGSTDLVRKRDMWDHDKNLFAIIESAGETWCVPFKYKCNNCNCIFSTNDGPFLKALPAFIRNQYPVDPTYAGSGHCHLSRDLSEDLFHEMGTYSNATQFIDKVTKKRKKHCAEELRAFENMSFLD